MELDFLSKIADGTFHSPLSMARLRADAFTFGWDMSQCMDALTHEMKSIDPALIV